MNWLTKYSKINLPGSNSWWVKDGYRLDLKNAFEIEVWEQGGRLIMRSPIFTGIENIIEFAIKIHEEFHKDDYVSKSGL